MTNKEVFRGTLTKALQVSQLPPWQNKHQVHRSEEGRIVAHKETRQLFKEIAKRNNTNIATTALLAGYALWEKLGYDLDEYNSIVFDSDRQTTD